MEKKGWLVGPLSRNAIESHSEAGQGGLAIRRLSISVPYQVMLIRRFQAREMEAALAKGG